MLNIKRREDNGGGRFEKMLRILVQVGNELSRAASVEELCRLVVELGRFQLQFDRMSIWFIDSNPEYLAGSFGIDETGQLRYELGERVAIKDDLAVAELHSTRTHSVLKDGVPLRDHKGAEVGRGSHVIAAIWNGEEVIGYLSADNLLGKRPYDHEDRELLELFASTFGHLYSLKKTEEALRSAYARLKEMQDELTNCTRFRLGGEVARGVVHEVKNPLNLINGQVEFLIEKLGTSDKKVLSLLESIRESVRRADNTIMGLLDFSKLAKLDTVPQNMNSLIDSSLVLVAHQLSKYGIKVIKLMKDSLPMVSADRNKIEQVMVNLLLNSVYSMTGGGELTIKTDYASLEKGGRAVSVQIEDTGSGIAEEHLQKIFDPFFTTRGKTGGTGIGLSVVKNIMDLHKGRVEIENRKDSKGAIARLTFIAL